MSYLYLCDEWPELFMLAWSEPHAANGWCALRSHHPTRDIPKLSLDVANVSIDDNGIA